MESCRNRSLWIVVLTLLLTLCGAGYWLTQTQGGERIFSRAKWLTVRDLQIFCEWPLTPAEVKGWLPAIEGKSLLTVRASKIIDLLAAKPWVKSVAVRKEFPDRLTIHLTSKIPRAIAVFHQQAHFVDGEGQVIEKATLALMKKIDLPFITLDPSSTAWEMGRVLKTIDQLKQHLGEKREISQVLLGSYPIFKIYLLRPKLEVVLSDDSWTQQIPKLLSLLDNPPSQIGQLQRINLVFPKKAIVSSLDSK